MPLEVMKELYRRGDLRPSSKMLIDYVPQSADVKPGGAVNEY